MQLELNEVDAPLVAEALMVVAEQVKERKLRLETDTSDPDAISDRLVRLAFTIHEEVM